MSHQPVKFRFGVEIEIVTGSRLKHHQDWLPTAKELSQELTNVSVTNHVNQDHNKAIEKYHDWSLIQETSTTNQMMQNRCEYYNLNPSVTL